MTHTMTHIARDSFVAMGEGQLGFRMPVRKYVTYCRLTIEEPFIDNQHPTCDECVDALWDIAVRIRGSRQ